MVDFAFARDLSEDEWIAALAAGEHSGIKLPGLPSVDIQARYVGSSGAVAFKEVSIFWSRVKAILAMADRPIDTSSRVLDFGIGWGRIFRIVLRDLAPSQIVGADVVPEAIGLCKKHMPWGDYRLLAPAPPYDQLSGDRFDLVYLYSVFSHLREERFLSVLSGLRKHLKLGGLAAFTTLRKNHLQVWESEREDPYQADRLKSVGFDLEQWTDDFEHGSRVLFVPTGGGNDIETEAYYGQTVIPPRFLYRKLPEIGFDPIWFSEPVDMPQALVVVRKV
jgi:hypothetical protein